MMHRFIFLSAFLVLVSCQSSRKDNQKNEIVFNKFPQEKDVLLKDFIKFDGGVLSRMIATDTTLIVYDWSAKNGYFFYEYLLKTKNNFRKYIPKGRGNGKALGSLSAGLYNNCLWMYDISLNKIIFSQLKTSLSAAPVYAEYPFALKFYNIEFTDKSTLVANGNYQTPAKLQLVDFKKSKIVANFGDIDDKPVAVPLYAWKRANEALMTINIKHNKIALAHLWSDQLEIFDLKSRKGVIIKGPENYPPEFSVFKSEDGKDLIQRNEDSRHAFGGIFSTEQYIYVMYSGNNMASPYILYGKTLYVYDWEGQPVKKINLGRYVSSFTVDKYNKKLYAYDVLSKSIVTASL